MQNKVYCPECNEWVEYEVRQNLIKEYRGVEVNVVENIGYCKECKTDLFVTELEDDNLKRLYKKYQNITGIDATKLYKRLQNNI